MVLVLRSLDDDAVVRRLDDGALTIGRGSDNDLVIQDPSREVSKTHCRIEGGTSGYVLTDLSINGVRIEGRAEPLGAGARHPLASGDVFTIGRKRFGISLDEGNRPASDHDVAAMIVPRGVGQILGGHNPGGLADRGQGLASAAVTGEAEGWLGDLPLGSASDTILQPLRWDEPPTAGANVVPEMDDMPTASEFANRSEHVSAVHNVLRMPQARPAPQVPQMLPNDWFADDATTEEAPSAWSEARPVAPAPMMALSLDAASPGVPGMTPATSVSPTIVPAMPPSGEGGGRAAPDRSVTRSAAASPVFRQALADGGRADPAALAGVADGDLARRCGEALRACLDAMDALEAAQAVAEHECGLATPVAAGLWSDFFTTNRDPMLTLLAEAQPGPAQVLAQRAAALADRQRAFGRAVADAAHRYDAALSPAAIEAETRSRLRTGPLAKLAAWSRFVALHAELALTNERGEAIPSFLALLRKRFARALNKRA